MVSKDFISSHNSCSRQEKLFKRHSLSESICLIAGVSIALVCINVTIQAKPPPDSRGDGLWR